MSDIREAHERALREMGRDLLETEVVRIYEYLRAMAEQGFELAPKEATEEMNRAAAPHLPRGWNIEKAYAAMYAAKPKLELDHD